MVNLDKVVRTISARILSRLWPDVTLLAIACFLCCVQVVQPFMTDHTIYARGGEALLDGGRLYTDFVDVKPPLIYEIYAACIAVFGRSTMAVRSVEAGSHVIAAILIFVMVFRQTRSRMIAHGAALAFGLYVASLWVPATIQPETLFFLPLVLLLWISVHHNKPPTKAAAIALGFVAGILFNLKYPFVLGALPVIWTFVKQSPRRGQMITLVIVGFVSTVALIFGVVWYDGIVPAMQRVAAFLGGYASTSESLPTFIAGALDRVTDFIANNSSLLLTTLALTAVVAGMMRGRRRDMLFVSTVSILIALAISIVVERKFNTLHMSRLIPPLAILAGYGCPIVWRACVRAWNRRTIYAPILVAMALIAIVLSPLPRVARSSMAFAKGVADRLTRPEVFGVPHYGFRDRFGMDTALAVVRAAKPASVIILGMGSTMMYWYLPDVRTSKFAESHFFTSNYAPEIWKTEAVREAEAADIIVLQHDDSHLQLVGHAETTRQVLMQRPEWISLFDHRRLLFEDDYLSVWGRL